MGLHYQWHTCYTLYSITIKTQLSDFITCNNSDHVMTLLTIMHTLHMFNRHQNTVTHTLGSCDNIYMLNWDCLNNDMYVCYHLFNRHLFKFIKNKSKKEHINNDTYNSGKQSNTHIRIMWQHSCVKWCCITLVHSTHTRTHTRTDYAQFEVTIKSVNIH